MVGYLEREELWIFEGQDSSTQNFKFCFLETLYNWSQVLDGGFKASLLDFVDNIMHERLRT